MMSLDSLVSLDVALQAGIFGGHSAYHISTADFLRALQRTSLVLYLSEKDQESLYVEYWK